MAAAAALLALLAPAGVLGQAPQPQPGLAESLCPRLTAPDPDCTTIGIPAEVWATSAIVPIKDDPQAAKAYDSLIPAPFFPLPGRRELGVLMFRLDTTPSSNRSIDDDPGAGYAEGSVAIRVGFPAKDGYPYREGWWVIAQPLNDQSQYGAGRAIGLPKHMADAGLRIDASKTWRAHAKDWAPGNKDTPGAAVVPGGNSLTIEWSAGERPEGPERREQLWTWGQYGEALFVQRPPYDEGGEHAPGMVKFTTVSTVPLAGAPQTPVTMAPDPRIGNATVSLDGKTPGGVPFSDLIGPGPHKVAGTSAFTRGFAFITSDDLSNNRAEGDAAAPPAPKPPQATCAAPAPGGEWRIFGQDLKNTRAQPEEKAINASNALELEPSFVFDTTSQGSGAVQSTPVVADGCTYFGTTSGWVFALNAQTGDPVWKTQLSVGDPGLLCTGVVGSTPVAEGRVFAIVSQSGSPYAVALDQRTGKVLWKSVIDTTQQVYNCGSPQVFDGLVIAPFTGDQTGPANRGGYTIFDARTGRELAKSYTIPDNDFQAGYKGGGLWTTPAVDPDTKYAYAGTANPDAGTPEHQRTNSIIKIDVDRSRATFGQIVDSYKGNPDRYVEGLPAVPLPCDPDHRLSPYIRSVLCAQMDLDFGASVNVLDGPDGRKRVAAMQKSGVFHMADADTMDRVWTSTIGPPVFYGNGSTAASDGKSLFVGSSPPGAMFSLDGSSGTPRWAMPIADVIHYQDVTYGNGLVFNNDAKGHLHIFRADTGALAGHRWIGGDTGKPIYAEEGNGSAALARNTLYVAASNFVVAYRNGATNPPGEGGPGSGSSGGCRDRTAPRTTLSRKGFSAARSRVVARGRATDRGCGSGASARKGKVKRVYVSLARVGSRGCRFVGRRGRLESRWRSCRRATLLPARGTTSWRFAQKVRLPRGRYRLQVRSTDAAGNKERPAPRARRLLTLR